MREHVGCARGLIGEALGSRLGAPGIVLWGMPGVRRAALDLAARIEDAGWSLIACPTAADDDNLGLAQAAASVTKAVPVSTSIANIYRRHPIDYAASASFLHEVTGGRFILGLGVGQSLPSFNGRFGVSEEHPVRDARTFIDQYEQASEGQDRPPVYLAALRSRMVELAIERFDGLVCANPSKTELMAIAKSIPSRRTTPFLVGAHFFMCVTEDRAASLAALKLRLAGFLGLPNYQAYFGEVGFADVVDRARKIFTRGGGLDEVGKAVTDQMVDDCCIHGTADACAEELHSLAGNGVTLPVIMPVAADADDQSYLPQLADHETLMASFEPRHFWT